MATSAAYGEARAIHHNLCNSIDRQDWEAVKDNTIRLGLLLMDMRDAEA